MLVTTDRNLRYQQNLIGLKIAIVVLGKGRWSIIKPHVADVIATINAATQASYAEVEIPDSVSKTEPSLFLIGQNSIEACRNGALCVAKPPPGNHPGRSPFPPSVPPPPNRGKRLR